MKIISFDSATKIKTLYKKDNNGREICVYELKNIIPTGESLFYPNVLLYSNTETKLFKPIKESTMSLKNISDKDFLSVGKLSYKKEENTPVFFFVYNTDNYFHFIYDSLPYLISYLNLKTEITNLKLLMNSPNSEKKQFYKFTIEFLEILGITLNDIILIDSNTKYSKVLISTSYTHDFDSNLPPRSEIYDLYKEMVNIVKQKNKIENLPKKIYISRRSWIHGDLTNIGTNYTSRRKLINEDDLVDFLNNNGFVEIFTEKLTTIEKILLFSSAETIVGAIGGGVCNVLFSPKNTKLITLVSPFFININNRFKYSLNNVNLVYFNEVEHVNKTEFKPYMRVKCGETIGEIKEINNDKITITYSDEPLSGWNNNINYKTKIVQSNDCIKLDNGLNSPWKINLESFKKIEL